VANKNGNVNMLSKYKSVLLPGINTKKEHCKFYQTQYTYTVSCLCLFALSLASNLDFRDWGETSGEWAGPKTREFRQNLLNFGGICAV